MLKIYNLTKIYKKGKNFIKANNKISFSVDKGEIVGILGPNGAGKTTLLKQVATLLIPDEGEILYKGISILKNPGVIRGKISFLLEGMQNIYPYLTGEANLLYFAYLNHIPKKVAKEKSEELLKKMGLCDVKDKYAFTYSSGMKKKLAIATCLINNPEIVFLDEPLSGLDVIACEELTEFIKKLVKEEQKTFIIASHRMDFIEKVTNRVLWIKEGKIIMEGRTYEMKNFIQEKEFIIYLRKSNDTIEKLKKYNVDFQILSDTIIKISISLNQKDLFYNILSNFEILNLEKKELDFEALFKKLYDKGN
jgi:ABC-2 type transport system ATP-binding protein/sodium transport system ATP-binding protein